MEWNSKIHPSVDKCRALKSRCQEVIDKHMDTGCVLVETESNPNGVNGERVCCKGLRKYMPKICFDILVKEFEEIDDELYNNVQKNIVSESKRDCPQESQRNRRI